MASLQSSIGLHRGVQACAVLFLALALFDALDLHAANYFGRVTLGGYVATEKFVDPSDGSTSNNFAIVSSRIYTRVSEMTPRKFELISDLRDKHDFFDKLDTERLQLKAANSPQVRQLSLKNTNEADPFMATLGRFPVPEAGAVNVDGGLIGLRWSRSLNTSLFGGLNPLRNDQSIMRFNRNSEVFGLNASFQPKSDSWTQSFFLNNAFVSQVVDGHTDRRFWYSNAFYQWDKNCQVLALLYLDFVPKVFVQTGFASWRQQMTSSLLSSLNFTSIDTIEYSRRQRPRSCFNRATAP